MSIYATLQTLWLYDEDAEEQVEVFIQAVPGFIHNGAPAWEFLPPPLVGEVDSFTRFRAVVFTAPWTEKGTDRNGQEYVNPLLILTGAEWETMPFCEVMQKLAVAIAFHGGAES